MNEQETPTLDLTQLTDLQRRLLTPDAIEDSLSYRQLQSLAAALGVTVVGMPKEEIQSLLLFVAYEIRQDDNTPTVTLRAKHWYNNGLIPEGYGIDWMNGEVRKGIPRNIYEQMKADSPNVWEIVYD